jgi:hypothetical protein
MSGRLDEIEEDLLVRLERAKSERILGEVEQLELTLTCLKGKKHDVEVLKRRAIPFLGIPTTRKGSAP